MSKVDEAIELLRAKASSMGGDELEALLKGLNFEVRASRTGKHCVVTHDDLDGFISSSFDKGHGKHVLPCYTRDMKSLITKYRDQLEKLLGEEHEQA